MNKAIFIVLLCITCNKSLIGQKALKDTFTIVLKYSKADEYLEKTFQKFHIDSIIDNRIDKVPYKLIGKLPKNKIIENADFCTVLEDFFGYYAKNKKGTEPIIARINYFKISEFYYKYIYYEGVVHLDIDFFKKNTNECVGHFHSRIVNDYVADHQIRLFKIFSRAFKSVDLRKKIPEIKKENFYDVDYVPKAGLYRSFLDYIYNTPFITKQKYTVTQTDINNNTYRFETKGDSLKVSFFGYSDGKNFYAFQGNKSLEKIYAQGRYLYLHNEKIGNIKNETVYPYLFIGIVSKEEPYGEVIFDLVTGSMFELGSKAFLNTLGQNKTILNEYIKSPQTKQDGLLAIQKLNQFISDNN